MSTIWRPNRQPTFYRGTVEQPGIWRPSSQNELYHYGRKGMKWYKHIFGIDWSNLTKYGTGFGPVIDKEKIKEIAKKLGIPDDKIAEKLGIIMRYFRGEQEQEAEPSELPAYRKTQKDANAIRKVGESTASSSKRVAVERANANEKAKMGRRDEYAERHKPQPTNGKVILETRPYREVVEEEMRQQKEKEQKRVAQAKKEKEARQKQEREEYDRWYADMKERSKQRDPEYIRQQEEQRKKEQKQKALEEFESEQRRQEELEYERYKRYLTPRSGGGHKF